MPSPSTGPKKFHICQRVLAKSKTDMPKVEGAMLAKLLNCNFVYVYNPSI
jgi:hypothetical protein